MKVVLLKKDSLVLHYTRYVPRSERKTIEIYDFRKASFDRSVTLARTTVLKMFESDEIRDVVRKDKAPPEDVPDQLE